MRDHIEVRRSLRELTQALVPTGRGFKQCAGVGVVLCGVLGATGVAHAQVADDAAALLARVRGAAGAVAWERADVVRIDGTLHASGLDAGYVAWEERATGRFDRRERFPVFAHRTVYDGRTTWRQDNSGGVHRLDGAFALRRSATDAWMVRRGWLAPAAGGAWVGPVAVVTVDGRALDVVTAIPRGGQPVTLSFDAATLDLARSERVMPVSVEETRYADYRDVDGVRLPFAIDVDDHEEGGETLRIARYDLHASADRDAEVFAAPATPHDFALTTPTVTVPFDLRNGVLTIEASIGGHGPYRFVLDTGGHAILSPELAHELGLATVGGGRSGGAGEALLTEQYTRVPSVAIGGFVLRDQHFYVLPMGFATFEQGAAPPLGGILGVELFERVAIRIDYPARTVTFAPFATHRFDRRAVVAPVRFDDDIPLVDGRLEGRDGTYALDTGNAGSMVVQRHWAERMQMVDRLRAGSETASIGAGGMSRNWASRVDRFEIGGATLRRVVARYAEDRRGAFASRTEAGNLGTQVLANFVVDFDYRRGLIGWRRVAGYVAPPFNRAGVRATKDRPEDFRVVVVTHGSPADEAGVAMDDRIVAIDGSAAATWSGADLVERLAEPPGTVVHLTLSRDGRLREAVLTLRELLP